MKQQITEEQFDQLPRKVWTIAPTISELISFLEKETEQLEATYHLNDPLHWQITIVYKGVTAECYAEELCDALFVCVKHVLS